MALKIEYVVQAFVAQKRGLLKPIEPHIIFDKAKALRVAQRSVDRGASVVVLEQRVDRTLDIFEEPVVIWSQGDLPAGLIDSMNVSEEALIAA